MPSVLDDIITLHEDESHGNRVLETRPKCILWMRYKEDKKETNIGIVGQLATVVKESPDEIKHLIEEAEKRAKSAMAKDLIDSILG